MADIINSSFFVAFELILIIIAFICTFIPITTQKQYILVISITTATQLGELTTHLLRHGWKNASRMFSGPLGLVGDILIILGELLVAWGVYWFQKKVSC